MKFCSSISIYTLTLLYRIAMLSMGLKDLAKPSPFHIKPKAHAEKEETSEDE